MTRAVEQVEASAAAGWIPVCAAAAIPPAAGVAARVGARQLAVLRDDRGGLHALDNRDPFTGANVLSRGIVGEHDGTPTVASPLRKQRFDLRTGVCLDDPSVVVARHEVREDGGVVRVRVLDAGDGTDICP